MDKNYRIVNLSTSFKGSPKANILIIYTGGTLGMVHDESGALVALKFNQILKHVPSLRSLDLKLTVISFPVPIDSSNINVTDWQSLGYIIIENYHQYDGFVVLHGTDTMAFTASALSFMLQGLNKPVVFTGAQLPISAIRTDARANLVTALEIAAAQKNGRPMVPEVSIYFDYQLMRGNRTFKKRSAQFAAFGCENYPILAKAGIRIAYNEPAIMPFIPGDNLIYKDKFDTSVFILKIFPSMDESITRYLLDKPGLKGVVLESYGSGNAPTEPWFLDALKQAVDKGVIIYNVSQLIGGMVMHGRYETSKYLDDAGVISGNDITREAAIAKLMFLLGNELDIEQVKRKLAVPLTGEMAVL
ncbi:MAG TPA: L-asparaginase 1 [Cytophagales bacterium]|jgi:L-asparaginase|nr:L-asparaginase 1 [Cytophagales bacterium]